MKYQYFIASRWRNKNKVLELSEKLHNKGKTVYSFLVNKEKSDLDPEEYMRDFEKLSLSDSYVKDAFEKDMNAQKNSDNLILLLPAGKSAHIEAGVSYGLGKNCILIGTPDVADSLYLIFSEIYPDIDSFIDSLK